MKSLQRNTRSYFSELIKPKLKIVSPSNLPEQFVVPQFNIPFCDFYKTNSEKQLEYKQAKVQKVVSRYLKYSSDKLNRYCKLISGKNVQTAMATLEGLNAKGAVKIMEELTKLRDKMDSYHSYMRSNGKIPEYIDYKIIGAYVGRKLGIRKPMYRAKGRVDMITQPLSRFYLRLVRVRTDQFAQEALEGKTDFAYAHMMRSFLFTGQASLQMLRDNSFMTTARGKSYRTRQIKRAVLFLRRRYYAEKGILLSYTIVHRHLVANLGKRMPQIGPFEIPQSTFVQAEQDKIESKVSDEIQRQLAFKEEEQEESTDVKPVKKVFRTYEERERKFNETFKKI